MNIKGFNEQFLTSSLLPICFQKAAVHFIVNAVVKIGQAQHVVLDQHVLIQILIIHNVYHQVDHLVHLHHHRLVVVQ